MALTEADLELLDGFLDEELSSEAANGLRARLASEPELADALEQVRFERDARKQFFAAIEPDNAAVQRLVANVHRSVNRELIWTKRARALRGVSGIAACLLVGFSIGYIFRGGPANSNATPGNTAGILSANSASSNREIVFPEGPSGVALIPHTGNPANPNANANLVGYEVSLTDDAGNVIGVQRFPTFEQARDFANDVTRWRKEHNQLTNGGVRVIGDQF